MFADRNYLASIRVYIAEGFACIIAVDSSKLVDLSGFCKVKKMSEFSRVTWADDYEDIKMINAGSFGNIFKAKCPQTGAK